MDPFRAFEHSLTTSERSAIHSWLGVGYDAIRGFQLTGAGDEAIRSLERNFSRAVDKAVVCTEAVFRGLSAGEWRSVDMAYLRQVIGGPDPQVLQCHDSASYSRSIGRDYARIGPDDEERHLAVLLTVRPRTARYLRPFRHAHKDEDEVVLLRGSRYVRTRSERLENPKPGLELWEVDWLEIV